jgi:peptidyl-prolyl cis-trans isomerase C
MRAKHILVQNKYEAEDILRLLKEGKDFSALAVKFSTCPSGKSGGDLGELAGKNLDEDFETALKLLKPGATSGAVRTRFGYHIIQRIS